MLDVNGGVLAWTDSQNVYLLRGEESDTSF